MKIQIIKDGSIQGWFVSFLITMVSVGALSLSLAFDQVAERFSKVASAWAAIVIGQFTAWLAYRGYVSTTESTERKDIRDGQNPK